MKGMWKFVTVTWHPLKTSSHAREPYEQFIPVIIAESIFKSRFGGRKTWRANLDELGYKGLILSLLLFSRVFYFLCLLIMSTSSRIHEAIICLLFDVFLLVLDHYDKHS